MHILCIKWTTGCRAKTIPPCSVLCDIGLARRLVLLYVSNRNFLFPRRGYNFQSRSSSQFLFFLRSRRLTFSRCGLILASGDLQAAEFRHFNVTASSASRQPAHVGSTSTGRQPDSTSISLYLLHNTAMVKYSSTCIPPKMGAPLTVPFPLRPMAWLQAKSPVRWTMHQLA